MEMTLDAKGKVESTEINSHVDKGHREYLVAYLPIPKGIVKEEPASEEDAEECVLIAYSPLPHSDIKEELEVGAHVIESTQF